MAITRQISCLPSDFSIDLLEACGLSNRAKTRGYQLFLEEYVVDVKFDVSPGKVQLIAKCYPSMRKGADPHRQIGLKVSAATEIDCLTCSCKAG